MNSVNFYYPLDVWHWCILCFISWAIFYIHRYQISLSQIPELEYCLCTRMLGCCKSFILIYRWQLQWFANRNTMTTQTRPKDHRVYLYDVCPIRCVIIIVFINTDCLINSCPRQTERLNRNIVRTVAWLARGNCTELFSLCPRPVHIL